MDRIAERIADFIGSAYVILVITGWCIWWSIANRHKLDFLTTISILALVFALFILRAEIAQSDRMEGHVKKDLRKSDEVLTKLKEN